MAKIVGATSTEGCSSGQYHADADRAFIVAADVSSELDDELLTVSDENLVARRRSSGIAVFRQPPQRPLHLGRLQQQHGDVSAAGSRLAVGVTQHGADDRSLEAEFQQAGTGFDGCVGCAICRQHPQRQHPVAQTALVVYMKFLHWFLTSRMLPTIFGRV